jgi:L-2-hydroxyglutarate oxidase LhgO
MKLSGADFLICGGGIIGLTIARELVRKGFDNIVVLEKEECLGRHASGRNSGVLHAGIYYTSDSLRAKSCLRGNFLMREYCKEKGLPLIESGKVIVANDEDEQEVLGQLYERAVNNGAKVEFVDEKSLKEIEPYAKTFGRALFSHYTAVIDPQAVLEATYQDLLSTGRVRVLFNTRFQGLEGNSTVKTSAGPMEFKRFINAAGAGCLCVAHAFGVGRNYRLLPFKGIYKKLRKDRSYMVKGNIYPVPDMRNPFLGVHFTRDIKGDVSVGPTAIPALGRENYGMLTGIDSDAPFFLFRDAVLFFTNPGFREVMLTEPKKYLFKHFFSDAAKLVRGLNPDDIIPSDKAGIRPQLVDWDSKQLVTDFLVLKEDRGVHILNTISPGFTSSMEFASLVVKEYL